MESMLEKKVLYFSSKHSEADALFYLFNSVCNLHVNDLICIILRLIKVPGVVFYNVDKCWNATD